MSNPRLSDPGGQEQIMPSDADPQMTDQALTEWAERCAVKVKEHRFAVADALRCLAQAAMSDADLVMEVPPETFLPSYVKQAQHVQAAVGQLDNARADLRSVAAARDLRLNRRDTEGSASRQHYIDTGNYLDAATS